MPRKFRIEYAGAVYHVMCRGDRQEDIFWEDRDWQLFLETLGETCERTGFRVHAYVLLGNHYHVLLETPEANLVAGMKWLQGTYTQRFNSRHRQKGHLFQGRYKALLIDGDEREYFRRVSDYIHLNPVRAGLVRGEKADLADYPWSSYPWYAIAGKEAPKWLKRARVWGSVGLEGSERKMANGYRERMGALIEELREEERRKNWEVEWKGIRRGWCLGGKEFRDRLQELIDRSVAGRKRASYESAGLEGHDERRAETLLKRGLAALKITEEEVCGLKQNEVRKQALAWLIKAHTVMGESWICDRLGMGDRSNVSRAVGVFRSSSGYRLRWLKRKMRVCTD